MTTKLICFDGYCFENNMGTAISTQFSAVGAVEVTVLDSNSLGKALDNADSKNVIP